MTNGGSGAVQLVLSVQDEKNLNSTDDLGLHAEILVLWVLVHHVKEVLNVAKVVLGWVDFLAVGVTVASGSNCGGTAENADDMFIADLALVVDITTFVGRVGLRVELAHSGEQSAHHSHRVSIMAEGLDERLETLVIVRVGHDFPLKDSELFFSGQLTVDDQVRALKERRFLGELLNGVASVLKNTLVTVNERDAGDARNSVHEGGVIAASDLTLLVLDLAQVRSLDGAISDFKLVFFT